jgi:hypothetical protein
MFDVLPGDETKEKFIPLMPSTNGIFNYEEPLSFTTLAEKIYFLAFDMIYSTNGKTEISPQGNMKDICVYQFKKKTEPLLRDTTKNLIKTDYCIFVQSSDEERDVWKNISKRLKYLDEIFYEEENYEKYQVTKSILLNVLQCFKLKKYPFIGIDDNGQIGAEWHDGNNFKIFSIVPRHEDDISFSCIKKTGDMLNEVITLDRLKISKYKKLITPLEEISW